MKKKAKIIFALVFIFIMCLLVYTTQNSLALFESDFTIQNVSNTGSWNVYINGSHVNNETATFVVDTVNVEGNSHVESGKMAPGTSAYFDINLVPTGTDVSIMYNITFDFSSLSSGFEINGISEINSGSLIQTGENTYTGVMLLDDISNGETASIRVNIAWLEDSGNDESDTIFGTNINNSVSIPITIEVIQYLNDEITPYVVPSEELPSDPVEEL